MAKMTETGYQGNIKEKIAAVRSVAHNKSNNEIVLVLQQFDNDADRTIQAFVDGSALQVLKEWSMSGKKKINKRKKSKSKAHLDDKEEGDHEATEGPRGVYGCHLNGFDKDHLSSDSANEKTDPIPQEDKCSKSEEPLEAHPEIAGEPSPEQNGLSGLSSPPSRTEAQDLEFLKPLTQQKCNRSRPKKTAIVKSHAPSAHLEPPTDESNKKRGPTIEKSVKDLQRCTVSLGRYRMMIKEEMDGSVKKIKAMFAELHSCIIDREVALMSEVDKVKQEAMNILTARQKKAEELKRMTDRASQMADAQLSELRAEIKHFVSERKYDEELGRSARFSCDIEHLKTQILHCGEISHPKNSYSPRTLGSTSLSSEDLHVPVGKQTTSRRNFSANSKVWERKATAKPTHLIPSDPTEFSLLAASTIKQNGPSNQRRRYNQRPQSLKMNGPPAHAHSETDQIAKSSSSSEHPQPAQNGFQNRNRGTAGKEDPPHPAQRSGKSLTLSTQPQEKHPELDPSFLCGSVAGVSHCHLPRMEISADAGGHSARTVTLVA